MLPRLREEGLGVGRDHHAGDDVGNLLERRDLRGKIVVHVLETAWVDQREALRLQRLRKAALLVAPGIAVSVVGEEATDLLVGGYRLPAGEEVADHVFEAPEEVIRPLEALARVPVATEEPRLPGHDRGDAGHFVELAGVADRVRRLRRRGHQHQVDFLLEDEIVCDFAGPVRAGLAVLLQHLDLGLLVGREQLVHLLDDEPVRLAERRQRAGLRRDEADAYGALLRKGKARQSENRCGLDQRSTTCHMVPPGRRPSQASCKSWRTARRSSGRGFGYGCVVAISAARSRPLSGMPRSRSAIDAPSRLPRS